MNAIQFYFFMRDKIGLSPRLSAVATIRLYAEPHEFLERYGRLVAWFEQRKRTAVHNERLTAALVAMTNQCRDNGYGAARRDKLGLT